MDKLKELLSLCKCQVSIEVNEHRNCYQSVEDWFDEIWDSEETKKEIDTEVFNKMKQLNTIITIQAYNKTPVGFFIIYHYDIDMAIEEMLKTLKEDNNDERTI